MTDRTDPAYVAGEQLMLGLVDELTAVAAAIRGLVDTPGDPGAIYRQKLELLERSRAKVDETEVTALELAPAPLPAEVTDMFEELRRDLADGRREVEKQLAAAVGPMN